MVCGYSFRVSRSSSYVKVIGSRSRSQEQEKRILLAGRLQPSIKKQSCCCNIIEWSLLELFYYDSIICFRHLLLIAFHCALRNKIKKFLTFMHTNQKPTQRSIFGIFWHNEKASIFLTFSLLRGGFYCSQNMFRQTLDREDGTLPFGPRNSTRPFGPRYSALRAVPLSS